MSSKNIQRLYWLSIVFYALWGAHAWFTWGLQGISPFSSFILNFLFAFIAYSYKRKFNVQYDTDKNLVIAIGLFTFAFFIQTTIGVFTPLNFILKFYPLYVLLSDKKNIHTVLKWLQYTLAIVLVPGILLHLYFSIAGYPPSLVIIFPDNDAYTSFNYFFLIKGISWYETDGLRFRSIFAEPGYAGTLFAFVLYASKYQLKKRRNLIIFIGLLMTLSLAGYVTTLLGYIFHTYSQKRNIKKYIWSFVLLIPVYYGALSYNGGRNYLNEYIFQRLIPDEDNIISGNNRNTTGTDYYFDEIFRKGQFLYGMSHKEIKAINEAYILSEDTIRGAGYKIFIIYYGIIPIFFYMAFYFTITYKYSRHNKKYALGFFLIIVITFLQASYPTSLSWLVPLVLGIGCNEHSLHIENA